MRTSVLRWLAPCAAAMSLIVPIAGATHAANAPNMPEVWIKSGIHSANQSPIWKALRDDTGDPWAPGAAWQTVLGRVKVVAVSPGGIQQASGPELQAAFAGMKRAHVALILGTGLLVHSDRCQARNEAMAAPGEFEQMLLKIQRNGGKVGYIAVDEPYWVGHMDASGCHQSAANLAPNVAVARRIFPHVVIGDTEVLNASRPFTQELRLSRCAACPRCKQVVGVDPGRHGGLPVRDGEVKLPARLVAVRLRPGEP